MQIFDDILCDAVVAVEFTFFFLLAFKTRSDHGRRSVIERTGRCDR